MRTLITILFPLLLASFHLPAAANSERQFASLRISLPDGFTQRGSGPQYQVYGPEGEEIIISVMRHRNDVNGVPNPDMQKNMIATGEGFLTKQAEQAGRVSVPLARETLPNGTHLASLASDTSGTSAPGYFVQYLLVSPSGRLAFISVEGRGAAAAKHEQLMPVVRGAGWAQ